jgi:hypothetical protein
MIFKVDEIVKTDIKDGIFYREVCAERKVEICVYRVMYGYRVRVGYVGDQCYYLDYCAGAQHERVEELFARVKHVLSNYEPEQLGIIRWPNQNTKPIFNDALCYDQLSSISADYEEMDIPSFSTMLLIYKSLNDFGFLIK